MSELKPCPFCGSVNVVHVGHRVICYPCGAEGPDADTQYEEDAAEKWNCRAAMSEGGEQA